MARVRAGSTTEVAVVLDNPELLLAGETVRLTLSMETVTTDISGLTLTAAVPSTALTIGVAHDVVPLDGLVRVGGNVVSGDGSAMEGTVVSPGILLVTIAERLFRLAVVGEGRFVASTVRAIAGGRTQVTVRVSGVDRAPGLSLLFAGETLTVDFVYGDGMGVSPPPSPVFLTVVENGVPAASKVVTLTATPAATSGILLIDGSGLLGAVVESVSLPVEIVPREAVEFTLSFATSGGEPLESVQVQAGFVVKVAVVLDNPGLLLLDEEVRVTLSAVVVTVNGSELTLTADAPAATFVIDAASAAAALPGLVEASGGVYVGTDRVATARVLSTFLPVEVLPREFTLLFATPGGEPLESLQVLAGGAAEVAVVLDNPELLLAGEMMSVTLGGVRASVGTSKVILTKSMPSMVSTVGAAHDVADLSGLLFVDGNVTRTDGSGVPGAETVRSELPVVIGERLFRLSVMDEGGLPVSVPQVIAGGLAVFHGVEVRVSGAETALGASTLFPGETLTVSYSYDGMGVSLPSPVLFVVGSDGASSVSTMVTLTLVAELDATSGMLLMRGSGLVNAVVEPASLPVRVAREFTVSFTTLEDEPLDTARVLAGGSTAVRVTVSNAGVLLNDEMVTVLLAPDVVAVTSDNADQPLELTLTAQSPRAVVTIDAAHDATPPLGTVMASGEVLLNSIGVSYTAVLPATLPVEIAPRQFRLEWGGAGISYTRSTSTGVLIPDAEFVQSVRSMITVVEDVQIDSLWVAVVIAHSFTEDLIVELNPPGGSMPLRLHNRTGTGDSFYLRRLYTSRDEPLRSLRGTSASGEWELTVGDYRLQDVGTLDAWGIGFGTPARVLAGVSTVVTMRLVGVDTGLGTPMLSGGETVTVDMFAYIGGSGVGVTPPAFTFTADETQVEVTVTASVAASAGFLSAAASPGSLPVNAAVESGARVVEIAPRRFRIELDVAGDSYTRSFSPGLLIEDNTGEQSVRSTITVVEDVQIESFWVAVLITHEFMDDLMVRLIVPGEREIRLPQDLRFGHLWRVYTSRDDGLVGTQAQGEWVLTVGDHEDEDVGTLDAWGIGFGTQARVVAGASTMVTMRLVGVYTRLGSPRLFPGEAVEFSAFEYAGVGVEAAPFSFTQGSTEVDLTLTASADATTVALVAAAIAPVNVALEPPFVALAVGIDPREFALVFTPPQIGLLTGGEVTVSLSLVGLTGASLVPGDLAVMVELTLSHPDELTLVTPATLAFDVNTMIHAVTLSAAGGAEALEGATLSASVVADHGVAHAMFASGSLLVNVIDRRDFMWVFRSAETDEALREAVVVAGETTRLRVSLEGAQGVGLLADEQVDATLTLTAPAGLTVLPSMLMLDVDMMSREVVLTADTGASATSASDLVLFVTDTTPDPLPTSVTLADRATLPVRVLRGIRLSFATPEDTPLEMTARVLAGGATEVRVVLDNPDALLAGETVRVSLSGNVVTTDESGLTLTAAAPNTMVTIVAAHDATPPSGTVVASGKVLLDGVTGVVPNIRVLPATLAVEIVDRQFRLELGGRAYTLSPGVAIPTGTTQSLRSTITVVEDVPLIDSFWVFVSITHTRQADLVVELIPPGPDKVPLRLHDREGGSTNDLRRFYTSRDEPLRSLRETSARGEWMLLVGDNRFQDVGTLDAWSIGFGVPVRVLAGASTMFVARLVGMETPLGFSELFPGETLSVGEFAYSGDGVGAAPFTFTVPIMGTGVSMPVSLTASAAASDGSLSASLGSPVNMVVEPATWPVEVVPRQFRIELDVAGNIYTRRSGLADQGQHE